MKKLLAVLLVMAMVLGMGAVVSASPETEAKEVLAISGTEEMATGETVTLTISVKEEVMMSGYEFTVTWDTAKFELATEPNKFGQYATYDAAFVYSGGSKVNNPPEDGTFLWSGANSDYAAATVAAGTKVASITLKALADVAVDDVVASLNVKFIKDDYTGDTYMKDKKVDVVATEKATTTTTTTKKADVTTTTTKAADKTTTTKAADKTTTTKAAEIKTTEEAIAAIKDVDSAIKVANKLTKADFANAADYDALVKAVAAKDLAGIKAALAKANEKALVAAVSAIVAPATTTAKATNSKTGDASNVAALMAVAMVAFGTAVVVYRKKVNA